MGIDPRTDTPTPVDLLPDARIPDVLRQHGIRPADPEKDTDPHRADPERCSHCGARSTGRVITEHRKENACTDNAQACECCYCPDCDAKSIYYRQSKNPDYRCINCYSTGNHPATGWGRHYPDRDLMICDNCGRVTLI